ncbi:MAG TPA: type II toxin-antitoxin system VapB family antitoxin [bacterium]|nr:type II toxin-antitoxin system VapB family antitoxin [bacterium]
MPSNLAIDDKLLDKALKLGNFKSKRETVNKALEFFIQSRRRKKILDYVGKIDFEPQYDHKKERLRR